MRAAQSRNGSSGSGPVVRAEQRAALSMLLARALAAKKGGGEVWEWAVKRRCLLQAGMSEEMLLCLEQAGLIEHHGYDVALTPQGIEWALGLELMLETSSGGPTVVLADAPAGELADDTVVRAEGVRPRWSAGAGVLWLGKQVVRRVPKKAKSMRQVLAALEEEHWPLEGIDNPLSPTKKVSDVQRLAEVIEELNQHQLDARIEFSFDRSKTRLLWRIL